MKPALIPGLPLLGPVAIVTDTVRFLYDARRYGDIVFTKAMGLNVFLVYRPDAAEHVLVKNQKNYRKDKYVQRAEPLFGKGLLRAEGDTWLRQRRLMQPGFHRQRIAGYAATMLSLSEATTAATQVGSVIDFHHLATQLTLEIAVQTMFGQSANADIDLVGKHLAAIMARFEAFGYLFEPKWWPSPSQVRYHRALAALDRVIEGYIDTRRRSPGNDILSMLLETRDENGAPMDARQIRDEVMTLFLAGHETTAIGLVFTWRLLALHPKIARALYDEVTAEPSLTLDALGRMPLLDGVIKESLRLHPPAYAIPREAIGPDSLCGYDVVPGTQVLVAVAAMHRDPQTFPEPDAFLPDRWTKAMQSSLHHYAYFPFGGGPRMCIGAAFADLELKIVLATLIKKLKPTVLSPEPLEVVPSLTQRPRHGLPARLEAW